MKNIDDKDYTILDTISKNAKLSTQQISRKTKIPITTVHNRIKKMESSGIIKGYSTILNNELIGNVMAFVFVSMMYMTQDGKVVNQEEIAKEISKNENVEEADLITGETDLIIKVRTKTVDELNKFVIKYIRTIPGIERTKTIVVLKSI